MTTIAFVTICLGALLYSSAQLGHNISKKRKKW